MAITPIGPAPVTSTSSPTTENRSAVCTALPSGSSTAATSSPMWSGSGKTFCAGITSSSANAPARVTPTLRWLWQNSRRPPRQLRQCPQVTCPSPETRWPTLRPSTSLPSDSITPVNSWPTTIGVRMVACAQGSHRWMCRSVPQIEVSVTRIRTS